MMFKLIARLFAAPPPEGDDILAHPALARMSPAELADLPLSPFSQGGTPRAPGPAWPSPAVEVPVSRPTART